MEVSVRYHTTEYFSADIEVDEDELLVWLQSTHLKGQPNAYTVDDVKRFLEAKDPMEWQPSNTAADWHDQDDPVIEEVIL